MLENNQPIEGLELSDVFVAMLRDIPWNGLCAFIQANAKIHKRCTLGGHRLDAKKRGRFEKIIAQEAEKNDFNEAMSTPLFAQWYPVHEELHGKLEEYFHSDEYKKHREDNELSDDTYVLTDEKFNEFFSLSDLQKWRILLVFSPLQFTKEQADKILGTAAGGGGSELLEQVEEVKTELENVRSELARLQNENSDLRTRLNDGGEELQQLRGERKALKNSCAALEAKFETSQNENRKLRAEIEKHEKTVKDTVENADQAVVQKETELSKELKRLQKEAKNWQGKYEKQCGETRSVMEKLQKAEKVLAEERIALDKTRKEVKTTRGFADLILEQMDWAEVGKQMKLTPQMKIRFKSLIRNLRYDDDNTPRIADTLVDFWDKFQKQERHLIEQVAQSDTLEVKDGDIEAFWNGLSETFEDVHIGLEARNIMVQMIREIFYQTLDLKNLKAAKVPASVATAKS